MDSKDDTGGDISTRKLRFLSPEIPKLDEIPEAQQESQATPLLVWLKKQVQQSWDREITLKKTIQGLVIAQNPKIEYKFS